MRYREAGSVCCEARRDMWVTLLQTSYLEHFSEIRSFFNVSRGRPEQRKSAQQSISVTLFYHCNREQLRKTCVDTRAGGVIADIAAAE